MKTVAISGSPRLGGNTEILLRRLEEAMQASGAAGEGGEGVKVEVEVEQISLAGKTIKPCTACGWCKEAQDRTCVMKDDDFHPVFDKMLGADCIVVGSPVYFGSATPEIMALLDRAGYVGRANGNLFSRKIGGPVVVARRAGQNFTVAQLLYWFMIMDMVVPGSSYWNVAFGRNEGDVEGDAEGLSTVDRFAENLVWLGQRLL